MKQKASWQPPRKKPVAKQPDNPQSETKSLIIGRRTANTLSKQQLAFNKLVKRIELLRQELAGTNTLLDRQLDFYGKHIYPIQQQLNSQRKECTRLLFKYFTNAKLFALSGRERLVLKQVIAIQLEYIFSFEKDEPEDDIKEIFKAVEGKSLEQAAEQDFTTMKDAMQDIFRQYGFDVDLDDIDSSMTQEELMRKITEKQEQLQHGGTAHEYQDPRKKSRKQLEKEAKEKLMEEARSKNISTLYKQLAKVFHPDLEQDPGLKIEKEEMMKQLTAAYEAKDLHTLLRLEITWIQKEENDPEKLSDEKLALHNQLLKEQVSDLENELHMLFNHPRYQPLHSLTEFGDIATLNLKVEIRQLQVDLEDMSTRVEALKGSEKQGLKEVKSIISITRQQNDMDEAMLKYYR